MTSLESLSTSALTLALAAASRRHEAIAANIANAGAAGYQPLRRDFESQLAEARLALEQRGTVGARELALVQPALQPALDDTGTALPVQLDAELAQLAGNAVHYQALLQGLSKHFALLAAAAGDGRR
jgi:flagellar basal-body rod protein FlgB